MHRQSLVSLAAVAFALTAVAAGSSQQPTAPQQSAPQHPAAQPTPPATSPSDAQGPSRGGARRKVPMDEERARKLYVPTDPKFESVGWDYQKDIEAREKDDARYLEITKGLIDYKKVTYRSRTGDMEVPAYLFQPLHLRGAKGHAAMVWVHGGVHGRWGVSLFPFVQEAVQRGYVVVAPEYRGSTGYGAAYHNAIDYGGYEVDDVLSATDYLKTLSYVDQARLGIMGWSHGGYITLLSVLRDRHPFVAAAAIVPVTNLLFRLSMKGPNYQWDFATQERIQALPFEKPEVYIERSPLYHVDALKVPLLVHVATNDLDVNFVEDQQMIDALRSRKPDLAETKIYVNPPTWGPSGGHAFSRRVDPKTLKRVDSPEQIDSWNRTWVFFEWNLRPYEDRSQPKSQTQNQ
jgi:dipeptidyl aminopeptidase/acylaminoacyl peptidase